MIVSLLLNERQPGDLGVLRGVAECVAEEARTRGFASLALVRFAFVSRLLFQTEKYSQFWDVRKLESVSVAEQNGCNGSVPATQDTPISLFEGLVLGA